MGLFNSTKREAKKQEKIQDIEKWNKHIRNCAQKNRVAQIQHLEEYLGFSLFAKNSTIVMAEVEIYTNDEDDKLINLNFYNKNGRIINYSLPIDDFEAARVILKIVPFFLDGDDKAELLRYVNWNHGSDYDCNSSYSGKRHVLSFMEEDFDTTIKSENDVFIKKSEIKYLSDEALLYFSDIIQCWKENNYSDYINNYNLWKCKRDFVIGYEKHVNEEINKRNLLTTTEISDFGAQGEESVDYAIKWLPKKFQTVSKQSAPIILKDSRISDEKQEIDHIVVGENGVFVIETKYFKGNITIDAFSNWSREIDGKIEGIKNPIQQVDRHHMIISSILNGLVEEIDIHDIICLVHDSCTIDGIDNSPIPVVKVEMLSRMIKNTTSSKVYSDTDIQNIISKINEYRI